MTTLKEGWIFKCGGSIKTWKKRWLVLKGNTLYYYAKQGDKKPKGTIELNSGMKVKDATCKRSPVAFSIETEGRAYIMYPETKSKEDCVAWEQKISQVINPTDGGDKQKEETKILVTPNNNNPSNITNPTKQTKTLVDRLQFSKDIVQFLRGGADNQMCEFWNLWYNTVNQQLKEDGECDIQFNFSYSSNFNKLFWNSAGPQYLMIQQLVDFFYIVGAPEEEIEKLNIVGEKINPDRIGSWINVSELGGIDGGWCFTFPVDIKLALTSVEEGQSVDTLLAWCEKHSIVECYYLARDMGAEPPRQTEVRISIPSKSNHLDVVLDAYDMCGFPHPPEEALKVLKQVPNLNLAINITEEEFVRISVIIPNPKEEFVKLFANNDLDRIQKGLGTVCSLEFQYLKEDYGYSVYQEGFDVHVNYRIC